MTLLERLDQIPPFLAIAFAYSFRRPRTMREISRLSGLAEVTIKRYAKLTTWDGLTVSDASACLHACGVDVCHIKRSLERIRRTLASKNGLLQARKHAPPWVKAMQARKIKRILKLLS